MKSALVYSPYLDSFGGGEWYTLNVATALMEHNYQVDLAWPNASILDHYKNYFDLDLDQCQLNSEAYQMFQQSSIWNKWQQTHGYDLIFFLSDGSIPFLFGRQNLLHFQVPFTQLEGDWRTRLKLRNQTIICNSQFTASIIHRQLSQPTVVLYPPVKLIAESTTQKTNSIVSVGRFSNSLHNKRQDFLVEAFKELVNQGLSDWELMLIGNDAHGKDVVKQLKKQARGYPVKLITNASRKNLEKIYQQACIYWHAAGYGIDDKQEPEFVEHFGISTVEAMSAGAIPVVIDQGGQKEIITSKVSGYLFQDQDELIRQTKQIIDQPRLHQKMKTAAKKNAQSFSIKTFRNKLAKIIR